MEENGGTVSKTLKNKDETITIRIKKSIKEKAIALHEKTGTSATLTSFYADMLLLGLQVKEMMLNQDRNTLLLIAAGIDNKPIDESIEKAG